jgi:hypothetical protein
MVEMGKNVGGPKVWETAEASSLGRQPPPVHHPSVYLPFAVSHSFHLVSSFLESNQESTSVSYGS